MFFTLLVSRNGEMSNCRQKTGESALTCPAEQGKYSSNILDLCRDMCTWSDLHQAIYPRDQGQNTRRDRIEFIEIVEYGQ